MKRFSLVPVAYVAAFLGAVGCGGPTGFDGQEEDIGSTAGKLGPLKVLTRSYGNDRMGANTSETTLTVANVSTSQFGRRFQMTVNDQVYAGLLYAQAVSTSSGTKNVVYAATMSNTVYAFDADTGASIWTTNLTPSGSRPLDHNEVGKTLSFQTWCNPNYNDIIGNIGIMGTPVIDEATNTMYLVTRTVTTLTKPAPEMYPLSTTFRQTLQAIDIGTGAVRNSMPISATVPGNGDGSSGGNVPFNTRTQNQRAALAMNGTSIYIAWSGHCDVPPYHGWVMRYTRNGDGTVSTAAPNVFNTSPNGNRIGIWQSGGGPLIDSNGNVYYATGNGSDQRSNSSDNTDPNVVAGLSESVLKFSPSLSRAGMPTFQVTNWQALNGNDTDLGSGGPSFLPGGTFLFTGGKDGNGYLLRADTLGLAQKFQVVFNKKGSTQHVHSSSTYWQSPQGLNMYVWGENDVVHAYRFNGQTFNATAVANGDVLSPVGDPNAMDKGPAGMPGGFMALSANGSATGTGILWATIPFGGDANHAVVAGSFRAFNAETLGATIFNSSLNSANDMGNLAKYNPPLVANGRVYVPSFSNKISVYGLGTPPMQGAYMGVTATIPGKIEAELYDTGGEGVAYHDNEAANQGGALRPAEGVDLENTSDPNGGGQNVGWVVANEWLEYQVNVTPGTYNVTARLSAASPTTTTGHLGLMLDGASIGTITFNGTGAWTTWANSSVASINLSMIPTGKHTLQVKFNDTPCNLNWVNFAASGGTTTGAGGAGGSGGAGGAGGAGGSGGGGTIAYNAFADTFGRDGTTFGGTNCNTATSCGSTTANQIEVKAGGSGALGFNRESYIQFTGVTGTTASNATLHLCALTTDTDNAGVSRQIIAEGIATDSWGETTLNWNNRPTDAGQNAATLSLSSGGTCLDFDVTAFVNAQLGANDHSISFRVRGADAKRTVFANRSAGTNVPKLTVTN